MKIKFEKEKKELQQEKHELRQLTTEIRRGKNDRGTSRAGGSSNTSALVLRNQVQTFQG